MHEGDDDRLGWELATESIVVRIRWFGIAMGYVLVQARTGLHDPSAVRAFLALGAGYAALDTAFHRMGEVFLKRWPLFVSAMEATFIALLCFHDVGIASPFRWYYLLSLICCAIRYRPAVAWTTFGLHCASLATLAWALGASRAAALPDLPLTIAILAWATWAVTALAGLLKATGARLERANADLQRHRDELEGRVAERTADLRAAQARVIHQEKMAAFGLLAAGIAHEVGNPLSALSSLIQLLERRGPDPYTAAKLDLAGRQVGRIRRTVRELVDFARPASTGAGPVRAREVVDEAIGIAKYYQNIKGRVIAAEVPADLPPVRGARDHLTQVVLNLVLNAIDATEAGGRIVLDAEVEGGMVVLRVEDDGRGIAPADEPRLFQPYFTTKARGTGLGLFVSRQIVEEMGGRLSYEPGSARGAVFRVRLPAMRAEPVVAGCSAGVGVDGTTD